MDLFTILSVLVTLTAVIAYFNERYLGLPTPIGVTIGGLITSLAMLAVDHLGFFGTEWFDALMPMVESFDELLMHGLLGVLLFAGALEVNLGDLLDRKWPIIILATAGVVLSTFIVGTLTWLVLDFLGTPIPYIYALLFGALISPTDPIAVLSLMKKVGAPKQLEVMISGESLFNDGVGVVVFIVIFGLAYGGHAATVHGVSLLFLQEAVGGAVYGFAIGYLAFMLLRRVDEYAVEILITLSVVTGGYALADELHFSGPIAMVVAGLFIGNHGRLFGMSVRTREHLDTFWQVVDEVLNAMLFLAIGLEVLALRRSSEQMGGSLVVAGLAAILIVLLARFAAVGAPIALLRRRRGYPRFTIRVLTWSGLRGGIAVALALSIPSSPERNIIVPITYVVVVFSILVQGLTVERLVRRSVVS